MTNGTAIYPQLPSLTGNGINDDICQHENLNRIRYPIYLDKFIPTVPKAVFDLFNMTTAQYPALNRSLMLFEGLSSQAVAAVPLDTTAIPLRDYFVLAYVTTFHLVVITIKVHGGLTNLQKITGRL